MEKLGKPWSKLSHFLNNVTELHIGFGFPPHFITLFLTVSCKFYTRYLMNHYQKFFYSQSNHVLMKILKIFVSKLKMNKDSEQNNKDASVLLLCTFNNSAVFIYVEVLAERFLTSDVNIWMPRILTLVGGVTNHDVFAH